MLSILPGGAAVVDRLGRAVWATPPAYSWGLVRDGRVVHPAVLESIRAVHADGGSSSLEVELRRRRGTRGLPVAVHVAPLTAQLAVVLAEDRSDARRVDDVRRDFVANVSHELKTPVGALSLLAEAVEGASDDPEAVSGSPAGCSTRPPGCPAWSTSSSTCPGCRATTRCGTPRSCSWTTWWPTPSTGSAPWPTAKAIDLRVAGERHRVVYGDREQLTMAVRNLLRQRGELQPRPHPRRRRRPGGRRTPSRSA